MFVAIAPHADDEIVGFISKLTSKEVKKIIFVCEREDYWFEMARYHCSLRGIEAEFYDYKTATLISLIEEERYALRKRLLESIWDNPALIPSYIDRNWDHTIIGMLLAPVVKQWSLFYSYTNTLPGLSEMYREDAEHKDNEMMLFYRGERDILVEKGIMFNYCYYEKVWNI